MFVWMYVCIYVCECGDTIWCFSSFSQIVREYVASNSFLWLVFSIQQWRMGLDSNVRHFVQDFAPPHCKGVYSMGFFCFVVYYKFKLELEEKYLKPETMASQKQLIIEFKFLYIFLFPPHMCMVVVCCNMYKRNGFFFI